MRIIGSSEGDPDSVVTLSSLDSVVTLSSFDSVGTLSTLSILDSVVSSTSAQYYYILITWVENKRVKVHCTQIVWCQK